LNLHSYCLENLKSRLGLCYSTPFSKDVCSYSNGGRKKKKTTKKEEEEEQEQERNALADMRLSTEKSLQGPAEKHWSYISNLITC
jgi:hypothetical protein